MRKRGGWIPFAFAIVGSAMLWGNQGQAAFGVLGANSESRLGWRTTGSTTGEISLEVANLYQTLLQYNQLPVQKVDISGKSLNELLKEYGVWLWPTYPIELQETLCSLNASICRNLGDRQSQLELPSDGSLIVPRIMLNESIVVKKYLLKKGQDPNEFSRTIAGCERGECQDIMANLNRPPEIQGWYVLIPTLAYSAAIDFTEPGVYARHSPDKGALFEERYNPDQSKAPDSLEKGIDVKPITPEKRDEIRSANEMLKRDFGTKGLKSIRMQPDSDTSTTSSSSYLVRNSHQWLFKKIHHPGQFHTGGVKVVVLDGKVDKGHCALKEYEVHNESQDRIPVSTRGICGEDGVASPLEDHGTHVAGLIAAQVTGANLTEIAGINTQARVMTFEVYTQQFVDPNYFLKVGQIIGTDSFRGGRVNVFNLSFDYPIVQDSPAADPIEEQIVNLAGTSLFVVSAGNKIANLTHKCGIMPACLDLPNIIAVGAVAKSDDALKLWVSTDNKSGSNFGSHVHIAAPGEDVSSTIINNKFGTLSGTSQATPIVAATAAALISSCPAPPAVIRNRLVSSADLADELNIFGGLLNVERALDFKEDYLVKKNGEILRGKLDSTEFGYQLPGDASEHDTSGWEIKRLWYSKKTNLYTLFLLATDGSSNLMKKSGLKLNKPSMVKLRVKDERDGSTIPIEIKLEDIEDYIPALMGCFR